MDVDRRMIPGLQVGQDYHKGSSLLKQRVSKVVRCGGMQGEHAQRKPIMGVWELCPQQGPLKSVPGHGLKLP